MSAPVQGRPQAKGGGEAEKRCQEEEGGGGAPELQRGLLRRGVRLRPGNNHRGSHRLFEDLLVKQRNSIRTRGRKMRETESERECRCVKKKSKDRLRDPAL